MSNGRIQGQWLCVHKQVGFRAICIEKRWRWSISFRKIEGEKMPRIIGKWGNFLLSFFQLWFMTKNPPNQSVIRKVCRRRETDKCCLKWSVKIHSGFRNQDTDKWKFGLHRIYVKSTLTEFRVAKFNNLTVLGTWKCTKFEFQSFEYCQCPFLKHLHLFHVKCKSLKFPCFDLEISESFCYSDFTWNQMSFWSPKTALQPF